TVSAVFCGAVVEKVVVPPGASVPARFVAFETTSVSTDGLPAGLPTVHVILPWLAPHAACSVRLLMAHTVVVLVAVSLVAFVSPCAETCALSACEPIALAVAETVNVVEL